MVPITLRHTGEASLATFQSSPEGLHNLEAIVKLDGGRPCFPGEEYACCSALAPAGALRDRGGPHPRYVFSGGRDLF